MEPWTCAQTRWQWVLTRIRFRLGCTSVEPHSGMTEPLAQPNKVVFELSQQPSQSLCMMDSNRSVLDHILVWLSIRFGQPSCGRAFPLAKSRLRLLMCFCCILMPTKRMAKTRSGMKGATAEGDSCLLNAPEHARVESVVTWAHASTWLWHALG